MRGDDRAVSEVVAFVLVFGIIIGSVALLSVVGFQSMEEYKEGEQLRNADRAMSAIADNFNDVLRDDGIEERAGELALREGTIRTGSDGATWEVTVLEDGNPTPLLEEDGAFGTFEYVYGDDAIAYEGGGVFRRDSSGNVEISEPPLRCSDDAAVVSLVAIDADDRSLQSSETQQFTVVQNRSHEDTVNETFIGDDLTVKLEVDGSQYQNGWDDVLNGGNWDNDGECEDVERVSVHVVVVDVEY
ncbi:hypothetical protein ACFOZ7_20795 [Natribaculum luteum]|uniref:Flagellin n=1 Tax=Natribaculum luteum TaxID=1586232 RepID=A0ABD5P4S6_9EURY|nr:hypothetical protein [Natribaculum luteum]